MQEVTYGAMAGAMLFTCATRFRPLLAIQRAVILMRAVGKVLPLGMRAFWRTVQVEFPECEREARREA